VRKAAEAVAKDPKNIKELFLVVLAK